MKYGIAQGVRRRLSRKIQGAGLVAFALVFAFIEYLPAHAAVTFRAAGTANNTSTGSTLSTLTIAAPTGAVAGDVLIAVIGVRGGTGTTVTPPVLTAPYDWKAVTNGSADSTTTLKSVAYYKVFNTGETSYVFTLSSAQKASGVISAYSGVSTTSPINVAASTIPATGSSTMTGSKVTTTEANTLIIGAFSGATGTTFTQPAGYSMRGSISSTLNGATSQTTTAVEDYNTIQTTAGTSIAPTMTTGSTSTVYIAHTIALAPAPVLTQSNYRWFSSSTTAGAVGSPLAAQNTRAIVPMGTPIRLRMLINAAYINQAASTGAFKIQYYYETAASCSTSGAFADVTTSTPIAFYDNSAAADGFNPLVASTGNDPSAGNTIVNQTYEEANNVPVQTAIPTGQDGMWDYSLVLTGTANTTGRYCLRMVTNLGAGLATYSQLPEVVRSTPPSVLTQSDYRLYQNADSLTPGSVLANTDTPATLSSAGQAFRVRAGISTGKFSQLSSGNSFSCSISSSSTAYCWGDNSSGQLGDGKVCSTSYCPTPTAIYTGGSLSGKTVIAISSGVSSTCAIASDGQAYCWGLNNSGEFGNGTKTAASVPTPTTTTGVLSGKTLLSISTGSGVTCAIASDNQAYCWGDNSSGQLGDNQVCGTLKCLTPVAVNTSGALAGKTIKSISAGHLHTCAIASDNQAYCWGDNGSGQLGDNQVCGTLKCLTPVAVNTSGALAGKTISSISVGDVHTCAIASDAQVYCWGYGVSGQLGNGSTANSLVPVAVTTFGVLTGKSMVSVSSGASHTCAVSSDGFAYCWGYNANGQLGDNQACGTGLCLTPVAVNTSGVLSGKVAITVRAGSRHACIISSESLAYCWGDDSTGQLGDGSTGQSNVPTTVSAAPISNTSITFAHMALTLQYAAKTAPVCRLQMGLLP